MNMDSQSSVDDFIEVYEDINDDSDSLIPFGPSREDLEKFFKETADNPKACECTICNALVGAKLVNLSLHLRDVHNIGETAPDIVKRGRPTRSFIWKYCTRENDRQAFCHLCKKLLFFGGGNTSNISKHLRRKHANVIANNERCVMDHITPELKRAQLPDSRTDRLGKLANKVRKERKGASYVWTFCEKNSRDTVRCKLCNKNMNFHGTANLITHLQRRHNICGKSEPVSNPVSESHFDGFKREDGYVTNEQDESGRAQSSGVWKYCKRISKDDVVCNFCKRKFAYQGTSNIQRHLHRMHGVVTATRNHFPELPLLSPEDIYEHCTFEDYQICCNLCERFFPADDLNEINRHLVDVHFIRSMREITNDSHSEQNKNSDDADNLKEDWSKTQHSDTSSENLGDYIEESYSDVVKEETEREPEPNEEEACTQFVFFDGQNVPSSRESSVSPSLNEEEIANSIFDSNDTIDRIRKERIRKETEYFAEKASYYRMQKYLAALHAKKIKLQIEQLSRTQSVADDVNSNLNTCKVINIIDMETGSIQNEVLE